MRLTVVPQEGRRRNQSLLVCVDGVPLPMQRSVVVDSTVGKTPTVTVTFVIDGDKVSLAVVQKVNS